MTRSGLAVDLAAALVLAMALALALLQHVAASGWTVGYGLHPMGVRLLNHP